MSGSQVGMFAIIPSNGVRRPSNAVRALEALDALICDGHKQFIIHVFSCPHSIHYFCAILRIHWGDIESPRTSFYRNKKIKIAMYTHGPLLLHIYSVLFEHFHISF